MQALKLQIDSTRLAPQGVVPASLLTPEQKERIRQEQIRAFEELEYGGGGCSCPACRGLTQLRDASCLYRRA